MKKLNNTHALALLLTVMILTPQALALPITVGNTHYEVSSVVGTWSDVADQLMRPEQAIWGDPDLAVQLASAVGTELGVPNDRSVSRLCVRWYRYWCVEFAEIQEGYGLLFAHSVSDLIGAGGSPVASVVHSSRPTVVRSWGGDCSTIACTWAVVDVSAIPLPGVSWLFGAALAGLFGQRLLQRRHGVIAGV